MSGDEVLGFKRKYADEKKEKRKQGYDGRIIRYHTFEILASKLVPVRLKTKSVTLEEHKAKVKELEAEVQFKEDYISKLLVERDKGLWQKSVSLEWLFGWIEKNKFGYKPPRINADELKKEAKKKAEAGENGQGRCK